MDDEIRKIDEEITALKQKLSEARRRRPHEPVSDYQLQAANNQSVALSDLFGDKKDLLVIHNMGRSCRYCTLWADGLNALLPHIQDRTSIVLASPDTPDAQAAFASGRNWNYRMVSVADSEFTRDMGFQTAEGDYWPGASAFKRTEDGGIVRTGSAFFGPGDDFCAVWPLFDLLADGANDWEPKYRYE